MTNIRSASTHTWYLSFILHKCQTGEKGDKYQVCIHHWLPLTEFKRSGENTKKSTSYPPLYMLSHLIPIGECGLIQTRVHWSVLRMLQWQWPLGESPYLSTSDITASYCFYFISHFFYCIVDSCTASGQSPYLSTSDITGSYQTGPVCSAVNRHAAEIIIHFIFISYF